MFLLKPLRTMSPACAMEISFEISAPDVPWTQWSGQSTWSPYGSLITSNGALPGCDDANEICPGVCQSWVNTTCTNFCAMRLMTGTTCSPSLTAKLPPGRKQFCTSTTISTLFSSTAMPPAAKANLPDASSAPPSPQPKPWMNSRRPNCLMAVSHDLGWDRSQSLRGIGTPGQLLCIHAKG